MEELQELAETAPSAVKARIIILTDFEMFWVGSCLAYTAWHFTFSDCFQNV